MAIMIAASAEIPPKGIGMMGLDLHEMGKSNPRIDLYDGMTKLDYVIRTLKQSKKIAEKFREDYGATTKSFTEENVFDYGMDGMGAIANDIIVKGKLSELSKA